MSSSNSLLAATAVLLAVLLDRLIGDPMSWTHPVMVMGWWIQRLRLLAERWAGNTAWKLRLGGGVITVVMVGASALCGWWVEQLALGRWMDEATWLMVPFQSLLVISLQADDEQGLKGNHQPGGFIHPPPKRQLFHPPATQCAGSHHHNGDHSSAKAKLPSGVPSPSFREQAKPLNPPTHHHHRVGPAHGITDQSIQQNGQQHRRRSKQAVTAAHGFSAVNLQGDNSDSSRHALPILMIS